jgi:hypothetical protein
MLVYFLSSPTPKQTVGVGEIRFQSPAIADNATVWTANSESDSSTSWTIFAVKPLCYCERPTCVLTSYTEKKKKIGRRFRKCETYKV